MKVYLFSALFFLYSLFIVAQPSGRAFRQVAQASIVPIVGTSGKAGSETIFDYSFNLLGGYTGATTKLELGGFMNMNRYYMSGLQMGGFMNLTGLGSIGTQNSNSSGWQLAGFMNATKGNFTGVNMAGFMNLIEQTNNNLQLAGFLNASKHTDRTTQFSGFCNVSSDGATSVQATGFANVTKESKAVQVAGFANVANSVEGIQAAGFLNVSGFVKGVQLGFINYADSVSGTPVGFISIVRKGGYRGFEISTDEMSYASGSFKLGVDQFYTLFNISKPQGDASRWLYGFGFGSKQKIFDKFNGHIEFLARQEVWLGNSNAPSAVYSNRTNLVNSLKIGFSKEIVAGIGIFFAPSINVSVASDNPEIPNLGPDLQPYWNAQSISTNGSTRVAWWPGISLGINL